MESPSSPSKEILLQSRLHFQENLSSVILQQERLHAAGKRPRRTRFVQEAGSRIQNISKQVLEIRKRVLGIHAEIKNLGTKVNRLDVIKEQACFFMSPKRVLSSAMRSPMKLTYYCPPEVQSNRYAASPSQSRLVEFVRRRKLAESHLSKVCNKLNIEKERLEGIFNANITILRFKRAEKCLIKMISLQSRLKTLAKEFEGLEERLSLDDSGIEEDYSYNIVH